MLRSELSLSQPLTTPAHRVRPPEVGGMFRISSVAHPSREASDVVQDWRDRFTGKLVH